MKHTSIPKRKKDKQPKTYSYMPPVIPEEEKNMKTDNELIAGNILIAKWMGKDYPFSQNVLDDPKFQETDAIRYIKYHSSWDWLMPVVDKCYSVGDAKEKEFDSIDSDLDDPKGWRSWSYRKIGLSTNLEQVYKNVVEFIKWHNANP